MNEAYINIMEQEKQLQLHITKNDRKIITDFANSLSDKEYQLGQLHGGLARRCDQDQRHRPELCERMERQAEAYVELLLQSVV